MFLMVSSNLELLSFGQMSTSKMEDNNGKKKKLQNICKHITSKRIELEGPCWSDFVRF